MFELAPEHYPSLIPLFGPQHIGAEVAGAVLAGNTQGKVFVAAPDDFRTAFVYDNGFCALVGPVATAKFAKSCLQWLYDHPRQDFFILYPSHEGWVSVLDRAVTSSTRKVQRVGFEFDKNGFDERRLKPSLAPSQRLAPMDAVLMRKVEATVYPWIGGTWKSATDFEERGVGFCVLAEGGIASLCYSVFVSGECHAIDILTVEKFRGLGLAKTVASAFIDECVDRGLQPTWDCYEQNLPSMHLAQALGFKSTHKFPVYSWQRAT